MMSTPGQLIVGEFVSPGGRRHRILREKGDAQFSDALGVQGRFCFALFWFIFSLLSLFLFHIRYRISSSGFGWIEVLKDTTAWNDISHIKFIYIRATAILVKVSPLLSCDCFCFFWFIGRQIFGVFRWVIVDALSASEVSLDGQWSWNVVKLHEGLVSVYWSIFWSRRTTLHPAPVAFIRVVVGLLHLKCFFLLIYFSKGVFAFWRIENLA